MPRSLPRAGRACPRPADGSSQCAQGLRGTFARLWAPAPRSYPLPPASWALPPTPSSHGVRHPCPGLPWYRNADSARTAAPPSRPRPWPPAVPSLLPGLAGWRRGGGGARRRRSRPCPLPSGPRRGRTERSKKEAGGPQVSWTAHSLPASTLPPAVGRAQVAPPRLTSWFPPERSSA